MGEMVKNRQDPILIILTAGIGDLVLASKGIRAVRKGFPDARIHLLTSTEASPIARNYPYIDRVWAFPIRELRGNRSYLFEVLKLIRELRKVRFNLVVNLYRVYSWRGAVRMGLLFLPLRARAKAGHANKGFGLFVDRKVPPEALRNRHFADAMMEIALVAGGIQDDGGIEVFWSREAEARWGHLFSNPGTVRIAVNPGADRPNKRWEPERYAFVADRLIERLGAEIILLGGPGEEGLSGRIQNRMKRPAMNLAGKLTLNDLVYIISRMDLLLTSDSGPMHIAAGVKTRLVALFGPEDPRLFGPCTTPDLYRVIFKDMDCRPCTMETCERPVCMDFITPEEVMEKCVEMLK